SRIAHRLPAAAERGLRARRVPSHGAAHELRPREEGRRRRVCAPPEDAAELARAQRRRLTRAGRCRARVDRARSVGARGGARAAGLGGGSSDAATALRLANATLPEPLPAAELHALAATIGADVPFFLADGPQLGTGDGTELAPLDLPQDFWILLLLPHDAQKHSTGAVYAAFDERDGAAGFDERRAAVHDALAKLRRPRDLAALPPNDLASSPLADELRALG